MTATPRYATPRTPDRRTIGPDWRRTAAELGRPLTPWQVDLADVAGEQVWSDELMAWRPAYPVVVVVVPRRAGKTTIGLVRQVSECHHRRGAACYFTADREKKAVKVLREEWWPVLRSAGLSRPPYSWRPRWSGIESGLFREVRQAGQYLRHSGVTLFSPTPNALHGLDADLVMVDEVWAFDALQGEALEAAIAPTAWSRPHAQHWYLSAGGEPDSGWLHRLMDLGRAGAPGVCYVEYSADREAPDYDPYDPDLWRRVHPGLGHTVDLGRLELDASTLTLDNLERSLLCVWDRPAELGSRLVGWEALLEPEASPSGGLILAVDVPPSRAAAAIAAADHYGAVELVEHRPGTGWLAGRLAELADAHAVEAIVLDPDGPAGATVLPAGPLVRHLDRSAIAQACGWLADQITEPAVRTVRLRPHPDLAAAIGGVITVEVGDGRFRWARRRTSVDLSALYAVNLAGWSAATTPAPAIL